MTAINAYLSFNGECREAMNFYQQCLGGELTFMTVGENPACEGMPIPKDHIMHSALVKGGLYLFATDMGGGQTPENNTISLALNCSSDAEISEFFTKLSEGGKVLQPLGIQFWGGTFGMVVDKYGYTWMLNYQVPAEFAQKAETLVSAN